MSKATSETLLIGQHELPGTADAHQFLGAQHGGVPVSFFLVHSPPGASVALHSHAYPEVFVLRAGRATFEVDEIEITAVAGDIVIAAAGAPHQFVNTGGEELGLTAIHPASEMSTHWLTPALSEKSHITPTRLGQSSGKEGGFK
ncbi:MAG: cupin domain-containing protein [Solirubrobacteraceae bacterium]